MLEGINITIIIIAEKQMLWNIGNDREKMNNNAKYFLPDNKTYKSKRKISRSE